MSALAATYAAEKWGLVVSLRMITILIVGWASFGFAELLVNSTGCRRRIGESREGIKRPLKTLDVQCIKIIIVIMIDIAITIMLYQNIVKIASISGDNGLSVITNYKKNAFDVPLDTLVIQLEKIPKGFAFVFIFIFLNNMVADSSILVEKIKKNFTLLIPVIMYCLECFLRGGRVRILAFLFGAMVIVYVLLQYKTNWHFKFSKQAILSLIIFFIVLLYAFWAVKGAVGRTSQEPLVDYVVRYIGGSYELLSLYLNAPPEKKYETFGYMVESINKIFGSNIQATLYHEFRTSQTGIVVGNVYTGMRNYYNDFGYFGVVVFPFILSVVFNTMLRIIRNCNDMYRHTFLLLFYSSVVWTVLFHFFAEYFFARISVGYIVEVIIMYICYWFMFKIKV